MRPDLGWHAMLATPLPKDLDFSSHSSHDSGLPSSLSDLQSIDCASQVLSEGDFESDPELPAHPRRRRALPASLSGVASDADADADAESGSALGSGTDVGVGQRSRTGDRGAVLGERRRDAAPRSTSYGHVPHVNHVVRPSSSRTLGIVPVGFTCGRKLPRRPLRRVRKKPTSDDSERRENFYDYLFK